MDPEMHTLYYLTNKDGSGIANFLSSVQLFLKTKVSSTVRRGSIYHNRKKRPFHMGPEMHTLYYLTNKDGSGNAYFLSSVQLFLKTKVSSTVRRGSIYHNRKKRPLHMDPEMHAFCDLSKIHGSGNAYFLSSLHFIVMAKHKSVQYSERS